MTLTPGSQTSASSWICEIGRWTPLMSTIRISGERCWPSISTALTTPPRVIVASGWESCARQSCSVFSVSASATNASRGGRPAGALWAVLSIGAGASRTLLTEGFLLQDPDYPRQLCAFSVNLSAFVRLTAAVSLVRLHAVFAIGSPLAVGVPRHADAFRAVAVNHVDRRPLDRDRFFRHRAANAGETSPAQMGLAAGKPEVA